MTTLTRSQKVAEIKRKNAEYKALWVAMEDEIKRFGIALLINIKEGKYPTLDTAWGAQSVISINKDMVCRITPIGKEKDQYAVSSAYICNDYRWESLMKQVNCPRNPRFEKENE